MICSISFVAIQIYIFTRGFASHIILISLTTRKMKFDHSPKINKYPLFLIRYFLQDDMHDESYYVGTCFRFVFILLYRPV